MTRPIHVVTYDIGTTGAKTCLFRLDKELTLDGGSEQRVDDWWQAMCEGTCAVLSRAGSAGIQVEAISFCCQMQALILVDENGKAVRNPMGYMDTRATPLFEQKFASGFPRIENLNARKLLTALYISGGAAATAKDPLWKYHWVRENEPQVFARAYKWLDVRDYLALRCTGNFAMTRDSAHLTFLYNTRPGHEGWSRQLCRIFEVDMDHLPRVETAVDRAGKLTQKAARALGLAQGIPVFAGGGDITLIPLGSGCMDLYDTHAYVGTSGWVVSNVDKRMVDVKNFIASISGAMPGQYNYVAEQETSGLCLQWVRDHLALDEIGVYMNGAEKRLDPLESNRLYELMNQTIDRVDPGSGGVIFTPWLHGNRSPREDAHARGMFFNIGLNTGKKAMIRAVVEGIAFHKRWMLEAIERKVPPQNTLRLVGGGARSKMLCQIMADVTKHQIKVPEDPQNAGAAGAAIVCAMGLNAIGSVDQAKQLIRIQSSHLPNPSASKVYDHMFPVFKKLYQKNKSLFRTLNA
ncbi:MAG: carbohydrate kinase [Desulfobacter sp.]|nr:MAG: carbohydrate kinase [Desulfobacter sp.]